jgi:hypothetical protein
MLRGALERPIAGKSPLSPLAPLSPPPFTPTRERGEEILPRAD